MFPGFQDQGMSLTLLCAVQNMVYSEAHCSSDQLHHRGCLYPANQTQPMKTSISCLYTNRGILLVSSILPTHAHTHTHLHLERHTDSILQKELMIKSKLYGFGGEEKEMLGAARY